MSKESDNTKDNPPALSSTNATIASNENISKLLRDVLQQLTSQVDPKTIDREMAINAMVLTCTEFMKSFIILGYDLDGNIIKPIFYAKTEIDADALTYNLHRYFLTQR